MPDNSISTPLGPSHSPSRSRDGRDANTARGFEYGATRLQNERGQRELEQDLPPSLMRQRHLTIERAVGLSRLVICDVSPTVDNGRYPAKATVGQSVRVDATIFADGHNRLAARVLWKEAGDRHWQSQPMQLLGSDHWQSTFTPLRQGNLLFRIEAWLDRWQNYHHELYQKFHAQIPVALEVTEGIMLLREVRHHWQQKTSNAGADDEGTILKYDEMAVETALKTLNTSLQTLSVLEPKGDLARQAEILLDQQLASAVEVLEPKKFLTRSEQTYAINVERQAAGFASWYELFPRSITESIDRHGTFDDVIGKLPRIRDMGFDVLYFPPIHPIGQKNRKGKNNSVAAEPGEPGSPYAIGSEEGGHDTVYSRLGGLDAFRRMRAAAEAHGLELALDFAIQCAPDHPWLNDHPDWFTWRPDGTIRYAENPPKKYQDIVNVDFYAKGAQPAMWLKWRDIVLYWVSEGVKTFRVDNPHTKPLPFWEWLIKDIREQHPDVIFLSEAFTRPAMMYQLAKVGFSQSYTYFIWRNDKNELTDYLKELNEAPVRNFYRPNFFVNTPDINPFFLQGSGRPGFLIRAALATTLSGLWGMYSGFELCEAEPLQGKEEYLNSEKYEIRPRDFAAPGNIIGEITQLNKIRKENPALQTHLGIRFLQADNQNILFFGKFTQDNKNIVLVGISLDPKNSQEATLTLPLQELGAELSDDLEVTELMRGTQLRWRGRHQHWYFNPNDLPFAIWRIDAK